MRVRVLAAATTLGAALVLSACSGSPDPAPVPAPSVASTPVPSSGSASPTDPAAAPAVTPIPGPGREAPATPGAVPTLPVAECLVGRYQLVRFVAVGGSTYGTGQGGDVTVAFDDGRYTLAGAGERPMVVTAGGQSGDLRVDGEVRGTYALKGGTATFTSGSTSGGGTLDDGSGGQAQRLTMKQVDSVIGLAGDGKVACTAQAMTITLKAIRLELGRV
ncbi:hypothetical protein GCM10022197_07260 [Microlunatus spumicola]|uniref:Lipoprotein n=1 Tax=Microlunatus spumicola TaxID=81499 RepID=A0ABP6WVI4_9ACTN